MFDKILKLTYFASEKKSRGFQLQAPPDLKIGPNKFQITNLK